LARESWGYTDNLCGSTTFDKTWNTGTCSLSPGALTVARSKLRCVESWNLDPIDVGHMENTVN
jgi:hypothetical protein